MTDTINDRIDTAVQTLETDTALLHRVVYGTASETIDLGEGGVVKSVAGTLADIAGMSVDVSGEDTAVGKQVTIVFGTETYTIQDYSDLITTDATQTSIGILGTVSVHNTVAIGLGSLASQANATAIGREAVASATGSLAIGGGGAGASRSDKVNGLQIGQGTLANNSGLIVQFFELAGITDSGIIQAKGFERINVDGTTTTINGGSSDSGGGGSDLTITQTSGNTTFTLNETPYVVNTSSATAIANQALALAQQNSNMITSVSDDVGVNSSSLTALASQVTALNNAQSLNATDAEVEAIRQALQDKIDALVDDDGNPVTGVEFIANTNTLRITLEEGNHFDVTIPIGSSFDGTYGSLTGAPTVPAGLVSNGTVIGLVDSSGTFLSNNFGLIASQHIIDLTKGGFDLRYARLGSSTGGGLTETQVVELVGNELVESGHTELPFQDFTLAKGIKDVETIVPTFPEVPSGEKLYVRLRFNLYNTSPRAGVVPVVHVQTAGIIDHRLTFGENRVVPYTLIAGNTPNLKFTIEGTDSAVNFSNVVVEYYEKGDLVDAVDGRIDARGYDATIGGLRGDLANETSHRDAQWTAQGVRDDGQDALIAGATQGIADTQGDLTAFSAEVDRRFAEALAGTQHEATLTINTTATADGVGIGRQASGVKTQHALEDTSQFGLATGQDFIIRRNARTEALPDLRVYLATHLGYGGDSHGVPHNITLPLGYEAGGIFHPQNFTITFDRYLPTGHEVVRVEYHIEENGHNVHEGFLEVQHIPGTRDVGDKFRGVQPVLYVLANGDVAFGENNDSFEDRDQAIDGGHIVFHASYVQTGRTRTIPSEDIPISDTALARAVGIVNGGLTVSTELAQYAEWHRDSQDGQIRNWSLRLLPEFDGIFVSVPTIHWVVGDKTAGNTLTQFESRLSAVEMLAQNNASSITTLQANGLTDDDLTAIRTDVASLQTAQAELQRVQALKADEADLQSAQSALQTADTNLASRLSALEGSTDNKLKGLAWNAETSTLTATLQDDSTVTVVIPASGSSGGGTMTPTYAVFKGVGTDRNFSFDPIDALTDITQNNLCYLIQSAGIGGANGDSFVMRTGTSGSYEYTYTAPQEAQIITIIQDTIDTDDDQANLGQYIYRTGSGWLRLSLSGINNTASGAGAVAMGTNNTASGNSVVALGGSSNTAFGINAVVMGQNNIADTNNSVAMGNGINTDANDYLAVGDSTNNMRFKNDGSGLFVNGVAVATKQPILELRGSDDNNVASQPQTITADQISKYRFVRFTLLNSTTLDQNGSSRPDNCDLPLGKSRNLYEWHQASGTLGVELSMVQTSGNQVLRIHSGTGRLINIDLVP